MSAKYSDARLFGLTFDDCIAVLIDEQFHGAMNFSCFSNGLTPTGDGCFYKFIHRDGYTSDFEEVTVAVTPGADGTTTIEVMSETQGVEEDFGKNRTIVDGVFSVFADLVPIDFPDQKTPAPMPQLDGESEPYVEQHARPAAEPQFFADPMEASAEHARSDGQISTYGQLMNDTTLSDYDEQYGDQAAQLQEYSYVDPSEGAEPSAEMPEEGDMPFGRAAVCHKCGEVLREGAVFCTSCGTKVVVFEDIVCPACGNCCVAGSHFCTQCGTKL